MADIAGSAVACKEKGAQESLCSDIESKGRLRENSPDLASVPPGTGAGAHSWEPKPQKAFRGQNPRTLAPSTDPHLSALLEKKCVEDLLQIYLQNCLTPQDIFNKTRR